MKEATFCVGDARLDELACGTRDAGVAPNVALGVATVRTASVGTSDPRTEGSPAFFDLASITKTFTALGCIHAGLPLSMTVAEALPELRDTFAASATLLELLSHRAGLVDHIALFAPFEAGREGRLPRREARSVVANRPQEPLGGRDRHGYAPVYSDLGYFLAGEMLAVCTQSRDAGEAIERVLLAPLGLHGAIGTARGLQLDDRIVNVVPTEHVGWRGGEIRGRVHDENAYVIEGDGGAGHAGLFGTCEGLLQFVAHLLTAWEGRGPLAHRDFHELLRRRAGGTATGGPTNSAGGTATGGPTNSAGGTATGGPTNYPGGTLLAGFDSKSAQGSTAGDFAGPRTFGHLGFTGTSYWVDPDLGVATVFLTNRVCPSRNATGIRAARPQIHDALFRLGVTL